MATVTRNQNGSFNVSFTAAEARVLMRSAQDGGITAAQVFKAVLDAHIDARRREYMKADGMTFTEKYEAGAD
jgi:hypothetical protein